MAQTIKTGKKIRGLPNSISKKQEPLAEYPIADGRIRAMLSGSRMRRIRERLVEKPQSAAKVAELLRDENETIQYNAERALVRLSYWNTKKMECTIPQLKKAMDAGGKARRYAITVASAIARNNDVSELMPALLEDAKGKPEMDTPYAVGNAATNEMSRGLVMGELVRLLERGEIGENWGVIRALECASKEGSIAGAIPGLVKLLDSETGWKLEMIMRALENAVEHDDILCAFPRLAELLENGDADVQYGALEAFRAADAAGKDIHIAEDGLFRCLGSDKDVLGCHAALLLGTIAARAGKESAIWRLFACLQNGSELLQERAAMAVEYAAEDGADFQGHMPILAKRLKSLPIIKAVDKILARGRITPHVISELAEIVRNYDRGASDPFVSLAKGLMNPENIESEREGHLVARHAVEMLERLAKKGENIGIAVPPLVSMLECVDISLKSNAVNCLSYAARNPESRTMAVAGMFMLRGIAPPDNESVVWALGNMFHERVYRWEAKELLDDATKEGFDIPAVSSELSKLMYDDSMHWLAVKGWNAMVFRITDFERRSHNLDFIDEGG